MFRFPAGTPDERLKLQSELRPLLGELSEQLAKVRIGDRSGRLQKALLPVATHLRQAVQSGKLRVSGHADSMQSEVYPLRKEMGTTCLSGRAPKRLLCFYSFRRSVVA